MNVPEFLEGDPEYDVTRMVDLAIRDRVEGTWLLYELWENESDKMRDFLRTWASEVGSDCVSLVAGGFGRKSRMPYLMSMAMWENRMDREEVNHFVGAMLEQAYCIDKGMNGGELSDRNKEAIFLLKDQTMGQIDSLIQGRY